MRCCWRATSSSRSVVASSPSEENSIRAAAARHGPLAAGAALALLDEPPLAERAQVVAARRGAVADDGGALGRRRLLDRVQVVEQREPRRVGERAHRARIVEGERVLERDLSKLVFREPGVKDAPAPSRASSPAGGSIGASPLRTQASVSRAVSSSGRVSQAGGERRRRVDREHPA